MSERNSGEIILAFILGGLVGAALGVIYAPSTGKETRQKLKDMGEDLTDKLENIGDDIKSKTRQVVAESKDSIVSNKERLEEAFEAGKRAFERKQQNA